MSFILIYITNNNEKQAKELAKHLLKKKLIVCANFFPIKSMYLWKNKIENDKETVLLAKTQNKLWNKLKKEIESVHPYECPCIIKLKAEANKDYEKYVNLL